MLDASELGGLKPQILSSHCMCKHKEFRIITITYEVYEFHSKNLQRAVRKKVSAKLRNDKKG